MKKTIFILSAVMICFLQIRAADAVNVAVLKFHVDVTEEGFDPDLRVRLDGAELKKDGKRITETWRIDEVGTEWSYFVEDGSYCIRVYDSNSGNWVYTYNQEAFMVDENHTRYDFDIKVSRPEGWVETEEETVEEPHKYAEEKDGSYNEAEEQAEDKEKDTVKETNGFFWKLGITAIVGISMIVLAIYYVFVKK